MALLGLHPEERILEGGSKRQNASVRLPDRRPMEDDEELEGEDMAMVRLDAGEIVQIPARFLEPREPEGENETEEDVTPEFQFWE